MKDKFLKELCEVLSFDPNKSSYSEAQKESIKNYRERKKLQGISTYVSSGNKKCYEKKKALKPKCELENCTEYGRESYKGYCVRCFVHLFPEEKVATCFKTKESSVVQFIKDTYYDKDWIFDKKIAGGCSRFRPDIFLDCLTHSLIIEVDENQHESYEAICENKRLMTLFVDLGERPVVLIRFNPDGYITKDGYISKDGFMFCL